MLFFIFLEVFIHRFPHNEITVYIVGIILTFMTFALVFHWCEDHFTSRYFSTTGFICYLSHTCKHSWPTQVTFSVISSFLLHCIALYVFRPLRLTPIDESEIYWLPFSCHQQLSWPTGWMNHALPLRFVDYIVFSFSRSFISYALVSSWLPWLFWAVGLNARI